MNDSHRPYGETSLDCRESLELLSLETLLSTLAPAAMRIDRDRLIFRAGQASARERGWLRRSRWAWPVSFGGMTAVAAALLVMLLSSERTSRSPDGTAAHSTIRIAPGDVRSRPSPAFALAADSLPGANLLWAGMPLDRFAIADSADQVPAATTHSQPPPAPSEPVLKTRSFDRVLM